MQKMKSGNTPVYRSGKILIIHWEGKSIVLNMFKYHDTSMEKIVTIQKGRQNKQTNSVALSPRANYTD
jgi:hypothetical protein